VDRARVVAGRAADPDAADEIMIGEGLAAQARLGVGDHLDATSFTPAQITLTYQNKDPGPPAGPPIRLRIVGEYRRPLDLGDLAASGGVVVETPAFDRAYRGRIALFATVLRVRTRHGAADVPLVAAAARRVFGEHFSGIRDVRAEAHGGQDAINVLALALWVFAGVAAVAGAVAIAIVLSRDVAQTEFDQPTLVALGFTRRQCIATLGLRVLLVVVGGAIVATVVSIAASPLFPIGIARRAEPSPGLHVDWPVLGVGIVSLVVFVALVGFVAALRVSRTAPVSSRSRRNGRSLAESVAKLGLRPAASSGVRMALAPGHGATAVPVRSAFLGSAFGVVGLTAVLVFASSLGHLDASPRLYGWTWDFKGPGDSFTTGCSSTANPVGDVPGVDAVAAVCYQTGLAVDGRPTTGWSFTPIRGSIEPEIVKGRAPSGPTDVALGAATMNALGKKIGDRVQARGPKATKEYVIVGQVVLPPIEDGEIQPLADGAAFTGEGFAPITDPYNHTRYVIGKFAPGVDHAAAERRVDALPAFNARSQAQSLVSEHGVSGPTPPPEVERLRGIGWFPPLLAVLIAVLALVAVGHALVTTARRRRSELAMLKTFGFERRQVRATIAWQATTLAVFGIVVGVPVGVVVGHEVWGGVAGSLGIASSVAVPALALVLTVLGTIGLVNLVASVPARTAARTWPARALAAE